MNALALLPLALALAQGDPGARVRDRLDAAQKLYDAQEYAAAIHTLGPVLGDAAATEAQKVQALETLGLSYLILGKRNQAREAFEDLLSIDQDYQLRDPSNSPKLRAFFEDVKAAFVPGYKPVVPARLDHGAPPGAIGGHPVELSAAVVRGEVAEVKVHWRERGLLEYREDGLGGTGGRFRGFIQPPRESVSYVLEYYLEARDVLGRTVARIGTPAQPLAIEVAAAPLEASRWYTRWWFWSAVGGAVAVGTVAGVMAATARHAQPGSLGGVTVEMRF